MTNHKTKNFLIYYFKQMQQDQCILIFKLQKRKQKKYQKNCPEYNFQYGYIFYRDQIDSPSDIYEIINLTNQVNTLPEKISKIRATGGGDLPEDWVCAYKLANEKINWRNGSKVIIHLTDAEYMGKN